jgi:hypothetical protein
MANIASEDISPSPLLAKLLADDSGTPKNPQQNTREVGRLRLKLRTWPDTVPGIPGNCGYRCQTHPTCD